MLCAAARCAVFVGASVCVLCCAVGCCCVLCRISRCAVRLGCSRCGLLSGFGLPCRVLCCAVCPLVRNCARLLYVVPPGVVLLCAVLFWFTRLVPLLVVPCLVALPVALGSCALRRCVLWCSPALCALCCVCFVVACWCVLLFAAVLCAVCVLGCGAVRSLSSPLCAVRCCAVLVRLRCAVCVVCAVAGAWCCAVSLGVLWCTAGSGGPWLSSGGVFRCCRHCLAAWPASLWLVRFAVVPCLPVSCSVLLGDKDKNADTSGGNPNPTPRGNSEPSGGQPNLRPTNCFQTQAEQELGTKRANKDGEQSNARKRFRLMRMAEKVQKKRFEVTCPAEL